MQICGDDLFPTCEIMECTVEVPRLSLDFWWQKECEKKESGFVWRTCLLCARQCVAMAVINRRCCPEDGAIYLQDSKKMSSQSKRGNPVYPVKQGIFGDREKFTTSSQ